MFEVLTESWSRRMVGDGQILSDITDDSSPFEFSVALDGQRELRMLTEAQGSIPSLASNWRAAWELNSRLERDFNVSLSRAHLIADLFSPQHRNAKFGLWHAACLRPGQAPDFKLYFNPDAKGPEHAQGTTELALARLGMHGAMEWLREVGLARGTQDHIVYFSLDLADHGQARTKIYVAHRQATVQELDAVMATSPQHRKGDTERFCQAMTGDREVYAGRPPITCAAFVGHQSTPSTVTLHLPVRSYLDSDHVALERICEFLPEESAKIYRLAVTGMIDRPLERGTGMQTYSSFRRQHGRERLTVYLSPEVYRPA
ncbi:Tryptophan dimethylallyltransferase [Enhygromyxa salina]|uniref:Tryptophan dimethylallyltransferase n=1 Tax=Enhygromyxa salina TaxID=215803 RepID=A0A2S9YJJ7_9BACT|nr:Tryptophan dimethylallyltransferase [Enhygromyxa salina]